MASTKPETAVVLCPKCGARFAVSFAIVGKRARCAACETPFIVPTPKGTSQMAIGISTAPPEIDVDMPEYIGLNCRVCDTRMYGRPSEIGKQIKCPDCSAVNVVPPPPKPKPKNIPAALEGEQYELWDPDEQPLPAQIIAAQPKYIGVKCSRCGTLMYATDKQVGQQIACPDCHSKHIVPPPPTPVAKKSVLVPDSQIPRIDPTARPAERPYVPTPVGKMVHEEQQEQEYARAVERSRRTGRPLDVDSRGRAIMPPLPLITGVIPFLFSRGALVRWLGYSAASMVYDMIGWLILWAIGTPSGFAAMGLSAIVVVCFAAAGLIVFGVWMAGLASIFFAIVTESSEGNRTVHSWPSGNIMDWLPEAFYLLVAALVSFGPGCILARLGGGDPDLTVVFVAIGVVLSFPIIVLSQLDNGSPFGILSYRVIVSLGRCFFSWLTFYIETGVLVGVCALGAYLTEHVHMLFTLIETPLFVVTLFLYARLLGRLGWRLAEAMPIQSN